MAAGLWLTNRSREQGNRRVDRHTFETSFGKSLPVLPVREHREGVGIATLLSLWRRRYLIMLFAMCSLLAAAGALTVLENRYAAEAVVKLDLQRPEGSSGADAALAVAVDLNALAQSEARILRSRVIARAVVDRLGLAADPRYAEATPRMAALRASFVDALAWARREAFGRIPGATAAADEGEPADAARDTAEERAVRELMSRLKVSTDSRSYLLTISYQSHNADLAARVANAVAQEYLARQSRSVLEPARHRTEWLAERVRETGTALRSAEAVVSAFRERTGMLGSASGASGDPENVAQQQLQEATRQLGAARLARMNEERRLGRVQELLRAGQTPSAADLQGSPLIANLLEREAIARRDLGEQQLRFGSRHPSVLETQAGIADLRGRIDGELRRAVRVIAGDVSTARETEANLQQHLDEIRGGLIGSKPQEAELRVLLTAAQTLRERLTTLERSYDQALAMRDLRPVTASLILPAEPENLAVFPRAFMVLAIGLLGGAGTGAVGALLLERRDQGLRTSGDLPAGSDTRCLAMVPELPRSAMSGRDVGSRDQAAFEEAVYAVGAGAGLFNGSHGCRTVLITSSVVGEGKSTLCVALARALSASGKRVMLVEGTPLRERGKSEHQREHQREHAGADAAPLALAGQASAGGGMLVTLPRDGGLVTDEYSFDSSNFEAKLEEARKNFDLIILEGAPVMLVADSLVLGRQADVVIYVARWAHTRRRVVEAALRRLAENSIVVDGIVLSRVDLRRHRRLHLFDDCSFYVRERRFYQRMAGHAGLRWSTPRDRR